MPSERLQINVRLTPEDEATVQELLTYFRDEQGQANITKSEILLMGLSEMRKRYLDGKASATGGSVDKSKKRH